MAHPSADTEYERLGTGKKLTLVDAIAQSVGFMGPVFSIAFLVPLLVGLIAASGNGAGTAAPLSVLIASVGVLGLGWIVAEYAKLGGTRMNEPCPYAVLIDRISPRRFFVSTRFALAAREGFVGTRFRSTCRASARRATSRSMASSRLRSWLRSSWATARTMGPVFAVTRRFCTSLSADDASTSNTASTRDSVLFACCPPGRL